jgi:hypothetical protein
MHEKILRALAATLIAGVSLAGCSTVEQTKHTIAEPYTKQELGAPGSGLYRVKLAQSAVDRLDVLTAPVTSVRSRAGDLRLAIPYAGVIYDQEGATWAYTNPASLTYVRQAITIESIEGDRAVLSKGPKVGTAVVVQGATELFGIEFGLGK